jgi:hypothetical protein
MPSPREPGPGAAQPTESAKDSDTTSEAGLQATGYKRADRFREAQKIAIIRHKVRGSSGESRLT